MSFARDPLARAIARHHRVARVVIARTRGSSPRETGAAMLVWEGGQSGTIGGGGLEHDAARRARDLLAGGGRDRLDRIALGPALGQCCGGQVTLLTEVFDNARVAQINATAPYARPTPAARDRGASGAPLAVQRLLAQARNLSSVLAPRLVEGWMIEPLSPPRRRLWVFGAGHVGRALVQVLAPLPQFDITWIDTAAPRFPATLPDGVTRLIAGNPADLIAHAPPAAEHLIVTYSHALDLELCHRLLGHGFGWVGLIGSATKWARFQSRLAALGHDPARISRITCPIGTPALGKHPQAIAVGVAAALLQRGADTESLRDGANRKGTVA